MKLKLLPKFVLSLGVLGVALTVTISLFSYPFFKRVSGRDVCSESHQWEQKRGSYAGYNGCTQDSWPWR